MDIQTGTQSRTLEQDVEMFKTLGEKAANIVEQICQLEEAMVNAKFSAYGVHSVQQAGILMVAVDFAFKQTNLVAPIILEEYKKFKREQEK